MAVAKMTQQLIEDGLLNADGTMTQKGHEYVAAVKKKYDKEAIEGREQVRLEWEKQEKRHDDRYRKTRGAGEVSPRYDEAVGGDI